MKPIIVVIFLTITLSFAAGIDLKTPQGALEMRLAAGQYEEGRDRLTTGALVDNILWRLEYLENKFIGKLNKTDRPAAEKVLAEIRFLVGLFPVNNRIVIAPYLPVPPRHAITYNDFGRLMRQLEQEFFSDDQLAVVRTAARENYFFVGQVEEILDIFSFEDDRLEAVTLLRPRILDPENSFRLYGKFTFSSSKEELAQILTLADY